MKYLIVGAGGTGGLLGGYLARHQHNVTLLARSRHLSAIQNNGLTIQFPDHRRETISNISALAAEDISSTYDVIIVCVKAYSLEEVLPVIQKASHTQTVVMSILNAIGIGERLARALPDCLAVDGCIYINGHVASPGVISQDTDIFRVEFGPLHSQQMTDVRLQQIRDDLKGSQIEVVLSDQIRSAVFQKVSFTSAFAAVAAYHHVTAGSLQENQEHRQLFVQLLDELSLIAAACDIALPADFTDQNINILFRLGKDVTASIQKDMAAGKRDEREQLIFDIVRLAQKHRIAVPHYQQIASHFGYY